MGPASVVTWWQWALAALLPPFGAAGGFVLITTRRKAVHARLKWPPADEAAYVRMDTFQRRAWGYRQVAAVLEQEAAFMDERPAFRDALLEHAADWRDASSEILRARAAKGLQAPTE